MMKPGDPEIVSVDKTDNAAVVEFKGEGETIFPAVLLYAARGVAEAINEKDAEESERSDNK